METLTASEVVFLHDLTISLYGGLAGMRDHAALEGALGRAASQLAYGNPETAIVDATVAVAAGIISAHPFIDGNKRTGLLVLRQLIRLNNFSFNPPKDDASDAVLKLASGEWSEGEFKAWVVRYVQPHRRGRARAAPRAVVKRPLYRVVRKLRMTKKR